MILVRSLLLATVLLIAGHAAEEAKAAPAAPAASQPTAQPQPQAVQATPVAQPSAPAPRKDKGPVTLAERFAEAAPPEPPAEREWTAILPGMDVKALAERLGAPDRVKDQGSHAEVVWRTGPDRGDPLFVVYLRGDLAVRMRYVDMR